MKPPVAVKLQIFHDRVTGLSMFEFSWFAEDTYHCRMEVANRPADYRGIAYVFPSFTVLAYDEAIDGVIGEAKRAALEKEINGSRDGELAAEAAAGADGGDHSAIPGQLGEE